MLNDYDLIISTRLHGAILANSLGKPAFMINTEDPRCKGALSLFPFVHPSSPESLMDDIDNMDLANLNELISTTPTIHKIPLIPPLPKGEIPSGARVPMPGLK